MAPNDVITCSLIGTLHTVCHTAYATLANALIRLACMMFVVMGPAVTAVAIWSLEVFNLSGVPDFVLDALV